MAKGNPLFSLLNDITYGKMYLLGNEIDESTYNPFIVNRGLSQHMDCIFLANEMNKASHLSKQMQHDFLFYAIPKKKRYGKWAKATDIDTEVVEFLMKRYALSQMKAMEYYNILTDDDLTKLKKQMDTGGVK